MKIKVKCGMAENEASEITVLGIFEDTKGLTGIVASFDTALGGIIRNILKCSEFKGKQNEVITFPTFGKIPAKRIMLVGLGKKDKFSLDKIRQASGTSAKRVLNMGIKSLVSTLHEFDSYENISTESCAEAVVTGGILGTYQFTKYKTPEPEGIKKVVKLKNKYYKCDL